MDQRVYMIQDGLSAHWTDEIREWAKKNRVTLVPTATNASWMNPVECHTGDIEKLALDGTDYRSWDDVDSAFQGAVCYRNSEREARSKTFRDTRTRKKDSRRSADNLCVSGTSRSYVVLPVVVSTYFTSSPGFRKSPFVVMFEFMLTAS
jgi:transposase